MARKPKTNYEAYKIYVSSYDLAEIEKRNESICLLHKQILKLKVTWSKAPSRGRQTSWLFAIVTEELYPGLPCNNSSRWSERDLNPETSGFQAQFPNHSAMLLPSTNINSA